MCHSRTLNNRINNLHHKSLRILYKVKKSSFQELLQKDKSVSVHMKNLQYLATEIIKVKNGLSPIIMNKVFNFQENESYNLRSSLYLPSRNMHTAHFGTGTRSSLGPHLWKLIPDKIKHASTLPAFKAKIRSWTNEIRTNAYSFFLRKGKKVLK